MNLNIRTRLSIQFAVIVGFILIAFSLSIYSFSESYHKSEFYTRLKEKALTTAKLLIEVKEVDYDLLKVIDRNAINALFNEKVIIYDYNDKVIYNSLEQEPFKITKEFLTRVRTEKEVKTSEGDFQIIGLLYIDDYNRFVVIASAIDRYGNSKLLNLKWILLIGFIISTAFAVFIGRIYAGRALMPIQNVLKQVEKISVTNLDMRVEEGNGTDEIAQLAISFNKMLERLESSFEVQRSFVSNASHELRTPLTSINGNIEVTLMKTRSKEEYENILKSILEDTQNLIDLSNRLLDLAKANSDISEISLQKLRIDELLWEAREWLIQRKKEYSISISFDEPVYPENMLTIMGNEHLLKIAIVNVMDNGCKYSLDKSVELLLSIDGEYINVDFQDKGIGIKKEDLDRIFQPFYRATNATNTSGHGLGLSLTDKIIEIHGGKISVESRLNVGTKVRINLPFLS